MRRGLVPKVMALALVFLNCSENDEQAGDDGSSGMAGSAGSSGAGAGPTGGMSGRAAGGRAAGGTSGTTTGGTSGTIAGGSAGAPTGPCASPEVRITDVTFGVNLVSGGNEGDTQPIPLAIAAKPNGGSLLAAMGTDDRVYV